MTLDQPQHIGVGKPDVDSATADRLHQCFLHDVRGNTQTQAGDRTGTFQSVRETAVQLNPVNIKGRPEQNMVALMMDNTSATANKQQERYTEFRRRVDALKSNGGGGERRITETKNLIAQLKTALRDDDAGNSRNIGLVDITSPYAPLTKEAQIELARIYANTRDDRGAQKYRREGIETLNNVLRQPQAFDILNPRFARTALDLDAASDPTFSSLLNRKSGITWRETMNPDEPEMTEVQLKINLKSLADGYVDDPVIKPMLSIVNSQSNPEGAEARKTAIMAIARAIESAKDRTTLTDSVNAKLRQIGLNERIRCSDESTIAIKDPTTDQWQETALPLRK